MFTNLGFLRERPIPALADARRRKQNYRTWPIDQTADAAMEPLAAAAIFAVSGKNYYAHQRNPPYWRAAAGATELLLVRHGVGERLARANARLAADGLTLFLFDAWRPRAVQAFFHEVWLPAELRRRRPELSGAALQAEVARYWAAPTDDPASPAPHATGGAVDLTVTWADGEPLFMGSLFDDASPLAHTDRFESGTAPTPSFSEEEARANRRLLYWVMTEAGFANHPDEWWHYSYGDQMWAKLTGAPAALYGLAEPPAGV
jgi:zinc D-Ala-D-Ala dipeptidase